MNYFRSKAADNNIEFNCIVAGNLANVVGDCVSVSDFNSILADLIENAIIATKCSNGHHIHAVIRTDKLAIDVYDSGNTFDVNVLANLGLKRITTHKDTGGSGIGLSSIYEFLEKYQASLIIDETKQIDSRFTKKISVCFNGVKEYRLITSRNNEELKIVYHREDVIIEHN